MRVKFYEKNEVENYKYVVVVAKYQEDYVLVKHVDRDTFEIPGGCVREGEKIANAAKRELYEETSANDFDLIHICDYGIADDDGREDFGALFYADVIEFGIVLDSGIDHIELHKEMPSTDKLTYPEVQPILFQRVKDAFKKI